MMVSYTRSINAPNDFSTDKQRQFYNEQLICTDDSIGHMLSQQCNIGDRRQAIILLNHKITINSNQIKHITSKVLRDIFNEDDTDGTVGTIISRLGTEDLFGELLSVMYRVDTQTGNMFVDPLVCHMGGINGMLKFIKMMKLKSVVEDSNRISSPTTLHGIQWHNDRALHLVTNCLSSIHEGMIPSQTILEPLTILNNTYDRVSIIPLLSYIIVCTVWNGTNNDNFNINKYLGYVVDANGRSVFYHNSGTYYTTLTIIRSHTKCH